LSNVFIFNGFAFVGGCAEKHSGSVVVLIVHNVHLIVPEVFFVLLLNFVVTTLQHYDLILAFIHMLFFNFGLRGFFFDIFVESSLAKIALEK